MLGFSGLAQHLIAGHPEHINVMGEGGMYPMHIAASKGHFKILLLLLAHGADVDIRSSNGWTPLHEASFSGYLEAGRCLLDHGADIDARCNNDDKKGTTSLNHALLIKNIEYTRMLLKRGAAVDTVDTVGEAPLHKAAGALRYPLQLTRLLLEHGADVDARNSKGETSLHYAVSLSYIEVAQLLLEYGADVHARNFAGLTARQEASLMYPSPNLALMELLRQHGDASV
jgi:serine/threonine-protein phosphatase 6 regulatory ankyrin repeat subunit B